MKRVHFTAEDLARTRVATTIGVAAETFDSVKLLRDRDRTPVFHAWRSSLRGRLGEPAKPLTALMPARGPMLDVTSIAGDTPCIEEAVENVLAAPRELMRVELEAITFQPAHRTWAADLVDGDREARRQLAAALRACHRVTIAPHWARVRSHLAGVRAGYARTMAEGGVERLLATLCPPLVRWRSPVLQVSHPRDADVHLRGRGLVITPTLFSTGQVELLQCPGDAGEPPVLAVPAVDADAAGIGLWEDDESGERSLGELLGRTRAAALAVTAEGCGTTELARRLAISPAAASRHATVLRNAGLITTSREGKAVRHTITPLGAALLRSRPGFG
ncbi:ArsR/SmtB family transcription factor [Saccharothrix australiensis]|uniref:ArsR/SmtB family transcription factor n=1 Tax=Saccharothrix australiensis TaxID=2072 RepID=UPI001B85C345|nr:winged helix-turn-helix domain-containing protein [Saccharothrix australiensis]